MDNQKVTECMCCKPHAIESNVKHYQQGTNFCIVGIRDGYLTYARDEFQPNDNDSGYFCGGCDRELTEKEVFAILKRKKSKKV